MSRERELLKRTMDFLECFVFYSEGLELREAIREFLSTPEQTQDQEPVAWSEYDPRGNLCALHRSFGDGLSKAEIEHGWKLEPLYLHPAPRKPFVRLSEEECISIHRKWVDSGRSISRFARAIEDALEEKNK